MISVLVPVFLFVHGLLHLAVWLPHTVQVRPWDPRRPLPAAHGVPQTPALPRAATGLASVTAILYVIAGAAAATHATNWPAAALLAACCGLLLKGLWFSPWLSPAALLDAGVVAAVLAQWPDALF